MIHITLNDYLAEHVTDAALADLAERIASACWSISQLVASSALQGNQGSTERVNPQGEVQKPLDILTDEVFVRSCMGHRDAISQCVQLALAGIR